MEGNVFLDVQLIQDGTARWLWMLKGDNAIYGAGVAMSYTDAERAGEQALSAVEQRAQARKLFRPEPTKKTPALNMTELEAGDGLDAERVRRDAEHQRNEAKEGGETLFVDL